jgi:hypothetical protein
MKKYFLGFFVLAFVLVGVNVASANTTPVVNAPTVAPAPVAKPMMVTATPKTKVMKAKKN